MLEEKTFKISKSKIKVDLAVCFCFLLLGIVVLMLPKDQDDNLVLINSCGAIIIIIFGYFFIDLINQLSDKSVI